MVSALFLLDGDPSGVSCVRSAEGSGRCNNGEPADLLTAPAPLPQSATAALKALLLADSVPQPRMESCAQRCAALGLPELLLKAMSAALQHREGVEGLLAGCTDVVLLILGDAKESKARKSTSKCYAASAARRARHM